VVEKEEIAEVVMVVVIELLLEVIVNSEDRVLQEVKEEVLLVLIDQEVEKEDHAQEEEVLDIQVHIIKIINQSVFIHGN
jgi:hypothetical protein